MYFLKQKLLLVAFLIIFLLEGYLYSAKESYFEIVSKRVWVERSHGARPGKWPDRMSAIGVAPDNPDIVLVGTESGFVYISNDGGDTWTEVKLIFDEPTLGDFSFFLATGIYLPYTGLKDTNPVPLIRYSHLWTPLEGYEMVTGYLPPNIEDYKYPEKRLTVLFPWGEFRWPPPFFYGLMVGTFYEMQPWFRFVHAFSICGGDNPAYFAATNFGVYRSTNQGITWDRVMIGSSWEENIVNWVHCDPEDPNKVYAITQAGLLYSTDGGNKWQRPIGWAGGINGLFVETDPKDHNKLYLGTVIGGYVSTDMVNFKPIYDEVRYGAEANQVRFIKATNDPNIIYVGTSDGAAVTRDGGKTWDRIAFSLLGYFPVYGMVVDPDRPDIAFILTNERIYGVYDTGKGIQEINFRYTARHFRQMVSSRSDPYTLWVVTSGQVYKFRIIEKKKPPVSSFVREVKERAKKALMNNPSLSETFDVVFKRYRLHWGENLVPMRDRIRYSFLLPYIDLFFWVDYARSDRWFGGEARKGYGINYVIEADTCKGRKVTKLPICATYGVVTSFDSFIYPEGWIFGVFINLTWPLYRFISDERAVGDIWRGIYDQAWKFIWYTTEDYWAERRRLLEDLATVVTDPLEVISYIWRIQEATIFLNILSGGMFEDPFKDIKF